MRHPKQSLDLQHQADIRQTLTVTNLPPSWEDEADDVGEKLRLPAPALEALRDARGRFFLAARRAGLNAHQTLHTWVAALQSELGNSITVDVTDYCAPHLAEMLQTTPEEIWNTDPAIIDIAIQSGRPLAEIKAEVERQRHAEEN